jgi:hypothetical protein
MSDDDRLRRLIEQVGEREIGGTGEPERYQKDRSVIESEDLGKRNTDNTDRLVQDLQNCATEWKPKEQ